jgi:8-oxo-dGTP pyrophosphatase MutT (NUDIX family)
LHPEGTVGASHPETRPVCGVVGVSERDGRLLMIQRSHHVAAPGAWCFPGGAVEPGETPQQALTREMREELDLDVVPIQHLWTWHREDGTLELQWWRVSPPPHEPRPNPAEVQDFRWMTPDEIRRHPDVLPNNVAFLDHYGI